jgi:hypothetical protein
VVRAHGVESLCRALVDSPAVQSVQLDANELPNQARIGGPDPETVSRAILEATRDSGAELLSLALCGPSLDESRAATAALWRAAYERAYYAAKPAPSPAAPSPAAPPAPSPAADPPSAQPAPAAELSPAASGMAKAIAPSDGESK